MPAASDATLRDLASLDARAAQAMLVAEISGSDGPETPDRPETEAPAARLDLAPTEADPIRSAAAAAECLRMLEALLFAATEPMDERAISARLPAGAEVGELLKALEAHYENRGVQLRQLGGRWMFATAPDVAFVLEREKVEPRKLSRAALETLAIIAYHQPCTRADIEDVRGVAVSRGSLDQLLEIGWVRLRGRRRDAPGRPVLYATTPAFLEHFGLASAADLPGMADLKAAGLLDARLPPGFEIPTPRDSDGDEDDETLDRDAPEFAQDFVSDDEEQGRDQGGDEGP